MFKYLINKFREYIFIILTATILLFISSLKSFSEDNIFVIDNVEVNGTIDLNFSRDKYVNQAFLKSFDMLTSRILLSRDLNKILKKNIVIEVHNISTQMEMGIFKPYAWEPEEFVSLNTRVCPEMVLGHISYPFKGTLSDTTGGTPDWCATGFRNW